MVDHIVNTCVNEVVEVRNTLHHVREGHGVVAGWFHGYVDAFVVEMLTGYAVKHVLSVSYDWIAAKCFSKAPPPSDLCRDVVVSAVHRVVMVPMRYARMRYQADVTSSSSSSNYRSYVDCMRKIYGREGGLRAFYRGTILEGFIP